jgi:hypothetical protein
VTNSRPDAAQTSELMVITGSAEKFRMSLSPRPAGQAPWCPRVRQLVDVRAREPSYQPGDRLKCGRKELGGLDGELVEDWDLTSQYLYR